VQADEAGGVIIEDAGKLFDFDFSVSSTFHRRNRTTVNATIAR
jgi:hypothetical protein